MAHTQYSGFVRSTKNAMRLTRPLGYVLVAALLGLWELAAQTGALDTRFLPPPSTIAAAWWATDASRGPGFPASKERAAARAARGLTPVSGISSAVTSSVRVIAVRHLRSLTGW